MYLADSFYMVSNQYHKELYNNLDFTAILSYAELKSFVRKKVYQDMVAGAEARLKEKETES